MPPIPRQTAYASAGEGVLTAKASFDAPTTPGSLLVAVAEATHEGSDQAALIGPAGWQLVARTKRDELTVGMWILTGAPSITQVSVSNDDRRALQLQVLEYGGIRQSAALDKVTIRSGTSRTPDSGSTGTLAEVGELVLGVIGSRYSSTQSGFSGGLAPLTNRLSPDSDDDSRRCRLTVHSAVRSSTSSVRLGGSISSSRDWVSIVATFRDASSGPIRPTATAVDDAMVDTEDWHAPVQVLGPPRATSVDVPLIDTGSETGAVARVAPFSYQYLLGGWDGLRIGAGTPWPVGSVDGLEGWEMRTGDRDLPRDDGAQRGVDLQSARTILVTLTMPDGGDAARAGTEARLRQLYDELRPRRDEDWPLIWRHPGGAVRQVWVRPVALTREMDVRQVLLGSQSFALRAADPRHYGIQTKTAQVPVAPAGGTVVPVVSAVNAGNADAYPVIRITAGATPVTRLELVNATAGRRFEYEGLLPAGSVLVADMPARLRSSGESVITVDGQSRYGGWQFPRDPFAIAPAPGAVAGANALYLSTVPAAADVECSIQWRDTWSG